MSITLMGIIKPKKPLHGLATLCGCGNTQTKAEMIPTMDYFTCSCGKVYNRNGDYTTTIATPEAQAKLSEKIEFLLLRLEEE